MTSNLLTDLLIIFGLSIPVVYIFFRLKISPLVGFLIAGILAGPYGLGLIQETEHIEVMSEIGVILLLFTIGIEFSLRELLKIKRIVLLGGGLQMSITTVVVSFLLWRLGYFPETAVFMGLIVALSSTAIVLKLLQEKGEIYSAHGRIALGILIFQDIAAVLIIILAPLLAGEAAVGSDLLELLFRGIGLVLLTLVSARYVVPFVLFHVAKTRNNELFLLSIVVIGLAVAWITSVAGLSPALGAFLAGLIISESEYAAQALGTVIPFKDMFMSIFFISTGMMLNLAQMSTHLSLILTATVLVLVLKTAVNALTTFFIGFPLHTMLLVGFSLAQVGEFSLVTAQVGFENGIFSEAIYQEFLAVTVLSMVLTPFITDLGYYSAVSSQQLSLPGILTTNRYSLQDEGQEKKLENHLIVIGYGVSGRNVGIAAQKASIPYMVIEINPETVRQEKLKGIDIIYGDAAQKAVLEHAGIKNARSIVITAGNPVSTWQIIETVKRLNPDIHIIARTHFLDTIDSFYALGADEVISDEFECSIELFSRVLNKYMVPVKEIETMNTQLRADHYRMLRGPEIQRKNVSGLSLDFSDVEIKSVRVEKHSEAAGKTLGYIDLRKKYGVTVLAISRNHRLMYDLRAETELSPDDILLVISPPEQLEEIRELFENGA
ncbi:cation:proton antiporter domain-containing protein [Methanosarcina sp. T3]|uniref:cation:proton antiporter domain-containing protein n=1 Tax=Methanosarcina sp. T3 TaxID=3439062 RepID=UPI003F870961